jgi:hypothetical protein
MQMKKLKRHGLELRAPIQSRDCLCSVQASRHLLAPQVIMQSRQILYGREKNRSCRFAFSVARTYCHRRSSGRDWISRFAATKDMSMGTIRKREVMNV